MPLYDSPFHDATGRSPLSAFQQVASVGQPDLRGFCDALTHEVNAKRRLAKAAFPRTTAVRVGDINRQRRVGNCLPPRSPRAEQPVGW